MIRVIKLLLLFYFYEEMYLGAIWKKRVGKGQILLGNKSKKHPEGVTPADV